MKLHFRRTQLWIFVFIQSVSCQDLIVEGFKGKSVLLPCSSSRSLPVDVFWSNGIDKTLLEINQGTPELSSQDPSYKGRVTHFPAEFQKKNFSIVLGNLKLEDAGDYECIVTSDDDGTKTIIRLSVKEDVRNSASCRRRNVLQMFLLSALSLLICF
ncbi:V-set domain-containing T-cell activation inhibitor 1-like [Anableps anableps]